MVTPVLRSQLSRVKGTARLCTLQLPQSFWAGLHRNRPGWFQSRIVG